MKGSVSKYLKLMLKKEQKFGDVRAFDNDDDDDVDDNDNDNDNTEVETSKLNGVNCTK